MQLDFGQRAEFADVRSVGIPRALLYYRYGIAWRTFFEQLGREVVVDAPSDRATLETGDRLSVDECCLASKLFMGHVAALKDRCDAVFNPEPHGLRGASRPSAPSSRRCPISRSAPSRWRGRACA